MLLWSRFTWLRGMFTVFDGSCCGTSGGGCSDFVIGMPILKPKWIGCHCGRVRTITLGPSHPAISPLWGCMSVCIHVWTCVSVFARAMAARWHAGTWLCVSFSRWMLFFLFFWFIYSFGHCCCFFTQSTFHANYFHPLKTNSFSGSFTKSPSQRALSWYTKSCLF